MKVKNSKGFTLAEMLIVMAVAVVLAAAAIPTISNQVEKARESNDAMALAGAYADKYASLALQAANTSLSAAQDVEAGVTLQQLKRGWAITAPVFGNQTAGSMKKDDQVTFQFSVGDDGEVSLSSISVSQKT